MRIMRMKCYGMVSKVKKASSEVNSLPKISRDLFLFLRLKSIINSSKRGGAGRSGAKSGAYRRHV